MNGLAELVKVVAFADSLGSIEVLDFERSAPDVTTCQNGRREIHLLSFARC
jgi:hypothetical protein